MHGAGEFGWPLGFGDLIIGFVRHVTIGVEPGLVPNGTFFAEG